MKLPRSRKSRQCRSRRGTRRSKAGDLSTISIDAAKRIVRQVCIETLKSAGGDFDGIFSSWKSSSVSDKCSCNNNAETEFTEFVSSIISQAIDSITSPTKAQPTEKIIKESGKKSRKRPRSIESKVCGLEYAESLHTMCSLFPLVMSSVETASLQDNRRNDISNETVDAFDTMRGDKESLSTIGYASSHESKKASVSHPSDYDSLLPPVGATSTTTTPTRAPRNEAETCTKHANISVDKGMCLLIATPQRRTPITNALERSATSANPDTTFSVNLGIPSNHQSKALSFPKKRAEKMDHIGDNGHDDCNYDRPIIGVVSDEGTGLVSHNFRNSDSNMFNDGDTDALIHIAKVGSLVLQKSLRVDTTVNR